MGLRNPFIVLLMLVLLVSGCKAPRRRSRPTTPTSTSTRNVQSSSTSDFNPSSYTVYNVRRGDTLYSLANKYEVSVARLLQENAHIDDPADIEVGQIVLIPDTGGVEPPDPGAYYEDPPATSGSSGGAPRTVTNRSLHKGDRGARFWWPTVGRVTRRYGAEVDGFSEPGIGIAASAGTKVCAVDDGTVIVRVDEQGSPQAGWANVIAIRHSGDYVSWYGLLGTVSVREWQKVRQGQKIGTVGRRGELAFRLYRWERPRNPLKYLP